MGSQAQTRAEQIWSSLNKCSDDERWYFFGYFFGDGNVYWLSENSARVSFTIEDSLLDRWIEAYGPWGVSPYKEKNYKQVYANCLDLAKFISSEFGITGPKSDIIFVPEELKLIERKDDFYSFVRGLFDSDGFVSEYTHKKSIIPGYSFGISSNSQLIMDGLKEVFERDGISCIVNDSEKCKVIYVRSISSQKVLMENLYKKGSIFLPRKHEKLSEAAAKSNRVDEFCVVCKDEPRKFGLLGYKCFYKQKRSYCTCGDRSVGNGYCSMMTSYLKRSELYKFVPLRISEAQFSNEFETRDYKRIEKALRQYCLSFYSAKHEGFKSTAEWYKEDGLDAWTAYQKSRSSFDVKPASWFPIKSMDILLEIAEQRVGDVGAVFDPFVGWGTRLSSSILAGKKYKGWDLNRFLMHELMALFGSKASIDVLDSFDISNDVPESDCVITCPPYWEAEDYNYKHKEVSYTQFLTNLSNLAFRCIKKSKIVIFAMDDFYYSGSKYKFIDDFSKVLNFAGFKFEIIKFSTTKRSYSEDLENQAFIIEASKQENPKMIQRAANALNIGLLKDLAKSAREKKKIIAVQKPEKKCSVCGSFENYAAKGLCFNHYTEKKREEKSVMNGVVLKKKQQKKKIESPIDMVLHSKPLEVVFTSKNDGDGIYIRKCLPKPFCPICHMNGERIILGYFSTRKEALDFRKELITKVYLRWIEIWKNESSERE